MKAVGIHVFAGGFSVGVQKVMPVERQLEVHNFGYDTARSFGVQVEHADSWEGWSKTDAQLLFGNPRCTGFSTITSGYSDDIHGPQASCTQDIHDLCEYGVSVKAPIIIWESVTQAYTTGYPLVEYLQDEVFLPKGYRVAHLFVAASTHGNAQQRKRYFFVAYDRSLTFNVEIPEHPPMTNSVGSKIDHLKDVKGQSDDETKPDFYREIDRDARQFYRLFRQGDTLTDVVRNNIEWMREHYPRMARTWDERQSQIPFSLHQPARLRWDRHCPTLASSCANFLHPLRDRTLTVLEAATLMGWPGPPVGRQPFAQIAKGVCPEVGTWLARQAELALTDSWGGEDYESSWQQGVLRGRDTHDADVKTFDLRNYYEPIPVT